MTLKSLCLDFWEALSFEDFSHRCLEVLSKWEMTHTSLISNFVEYPPSSFPIQLKITVFLVQDWLKDDVGLEPQA